MPTNEERLIQANAELTKSVMNMNRSLAQGNPAYAKQVKSLESNQRALMGRSKSEKSLAGAMHGMHDAVGSLGDTFSKDFKSIVNPMNLVGTAIREGIETAMAVQKTALQLGMEVDDVIGKFPGEMSTAIGGFAANLQTTMMQTDIGMKDLGKHTSMAAVRTEALGGNTAALVRAQRRMETHLGLDAAAVNKSSENMILLSQQYGISTDRLIGGLDALASNFGTFAALGTGQKMQDAVMEFTAQMGAGNEKLVAEFTKSLTEVGGQSLQFAVLGGIQDLQHEITKGNVDANTLRKAAMQQGARLQGIVTQMQEGGVNMTVAMDYLGKLYGQGAVAALQMFNQQKNMTDEQRKQLKVSEDWGNTLKLLKDEIMTPIKVSLSKHLPPIIDKLKTMVPLFQGILKAVMISAAAIAMKRGLGGMLAGATQKGGPDIMRMAGGLGMATMGGLGGSIGMGAELGTGGLATAGLATALPMLLGTMFGKKKGMAGALQYGFGKGGGAGGEMFAGKLGTRSNPMYVIQIAGAAGMAGGLMDMFGGKGGGGKLGKLLGKGSGLDRALSKGATGALKGTAKVLGPGVKRIFGRGAAKAFGGFMGKRMATVAVANMVPVAGQILTVGFLAWEGFQYFKRRKEERAYQREMEIRDDLAERNQERIKDEINAFNEGMSKSTSYLRITNEQLRSDMQRQYYGEGGMSARLVELIGEIKAGHGPAAATAEATAEMAAARSVEAAGGE